MQSIRRRHAVEVLLVIVFAAAALPPQVVSAQSLPGWSYTTNTTVDSGGPNRTSSMVMRQRVTDRYLRTEFLQVSGFKSP
ncbi:MAG TPA: hypothetical protein VGM50_19345, partial [Gemmatimonadaceae bacterium]